MRWHFWFESLAYIVAFRVYMRQRQTTGDFLKAETRWSIIVAAVIGAAIGSKLLYWCEDPIRTAQEWNNLQYLLGGKTIVGALLEEHSRSNLPSGAPEYGVELATFSRYRSQLESPSAVSAAF